MSLIVRVPINQKYHKNHEFGCSFASSCCYDLSHGVEGCLDLVIVFDEGVYAPAYFVDLEMMQEVGVVAVGGDYGKAPLHCLLDNYAYFGHS